MMVESTKEVDVTTLVTPSETLCERVDTLVRAHDDSWPPLHSATTSAAIAKIILHIDDLEKAIQEMAIEIQRLAFERDRLAARATDN
jgi:hypothetical protein